MMNQAKNEKENRNQPMMLALLKKISPITGILDKTGMDVFPKATLILSVCPLLYIALTRKTANGGAIKFNTVPETIWSARK